MKNIDRITKRVILQLVLFILFLQLLVGVPASSQAPNYTIPIPYPFKIVSVVPYNNGFLIAGYRVQKVQGIAIPNTGFSYNLTSDINVSVYYTNLSSYQLLFTKELDNVLYLGIGFGNYTSLNFPYLDIQLNLFNGSVGFLMTWTSLHNSSGTYTEIRNIFTYSVKGLNLYNNYYYSNTVYSFTLSNPYALFQYVEQILDNAIIFPTETEIGNITFISVGCAPIHSETQVVINGTSIKAASSYPSVDKVIGIEDGKVVFNLTLTNSSIAPLFPYKVSSGAIYAVGESIKVLTLGMNSISPTVVNSLYEYNFTVVKLSQDKLSPVNSTLFYVPNPEYGQGVSTEHLLILSGYSGNSYKPNPLYLLNYNYSFTVTGQGFKLDSEYAINTTNGQEIPLPVLYSYSVIAGERTYFYAVVNGFTYVYTVEKGGIKNITFSSDVFRLISTITFSDFLEVLYTNGTNEVIYNNCTVAYYNYHFDQNLTNGNYLNEFNSSFSGLECNYFHNGTVKMLLFSLSGVPYSVVYLNNSTYNVLNGSTIYVFYESDFGLQISEIPIVQNVKVQLVKPPTISPPKLSLKVLLMSTSGISLQGVIYVNGEEIMVGVNGYTLSGLSAGSLTITAEANGYLPNTTSVVLSTNSTLVIYLKPVPFQLSLNGEVTNATQTSQGMYSVNVKQGEVLNLTVEVENLTAYLNGSPLKVVKIGPWYEVYINFTQPGIYNLTLVYGDPQMTFIVHVQQTAVTTTHPTSSTVPPSTTTPPTSSLTSSITSTTSVTSSSSTYMSSSPTPSPTSTSSTFPTALVFIAVIIVVVIVVALLVVKRR